MDQGVRRVTIRKSDSPSSSLPSTSRLWEPLAYPLLFLHGTLGWGARDNHDEDPSGSQMWYYRFNLLHEPWFSIFGCLTNEYLADMSSRDLKCRLRSIRCNQESMRAQGTDLMDVGGTNMSGSVYLPASFLGSRRWSSEQVTDSLAIAAHFGNPSFFITMASNPDWPEIAAALRPGQTYTGVPILVARVFQRFSVHPNTENYVCRHRSSCVHYPPRRISKWWFTACSHPYLLFWL